MKIDSDKVSYAAVNGIPLVITSHKLPPDTETDLEEILMIFLGRMGQLELKDLLAYCLRELTGNAKKANTKRIYFREKHLDIGDESDYEKGMQAFKKDTLGNIQHFLDLQEKADLFIKVSFLIRNNVLYLSVRNNAPIAPKELTRVYDRVTRSRAFNSMDEVFTEVVDDSEGAGLGIIILILTLRKMGLNEKSFTLTSTESETSASLTIPMHSVRREQLSALSGEFLEAIETLPPFPENLQSLLALLDKPDVSFEALATQLARDPALTADLIKYINSARFGVKKRINDLQEAIQFTGIQGLRDLVLPYGAHKLLGKYLADQKNLWDNAVRVSFYSSELARERHFTREAQSLAQIGGLLYNMGQIIVTYLHPDQSSRILDFCRAKGFGIDLFDSLTQSINPAELGARIAEKWNFPEPLIHVLRNQNQPQNAPADLQEITSAVHLAAGLVAQEQGLMTLGQVHAGVRSAFGLGTPGAAEDLHQKLKALFPG